MTDEISLIAVAGNLAGSHVHYPYAEADRFRVMVDMFENRDDDTPSYSGTIGALFDINLEGAPDLFSPQELDELMSEFEATGCFAWGMGFWVVRPGERPPQMPEPGFPSPK